MVSDSLNHGHLRIVRIALYTKRRPLRVIVRCLHLHLCVLVQDFALQRLVVFGFYAYGKLYAGSDVDLSIIKLVHENASKSAGQWIALIT